MRKCKARKKARLRVKRVLKNKEKDMYKKRRKKWLEF